MPKQMECRILITHHRDGRSFALGMYDPVAMRHEPLGNNHPKRDIEKIVRGLRERMEQERHKVTFSEVTGPR